MQNAGSRSFQGFSLFINRFSKILWHFLRLLECGKMMVSLYFARGFQSINKICKKGSFQRMVLGEKQTNVGNNHNYNMSAKRTCGQ